MTSAAAAQPILSFDLSDEGGHMTDPFEQGERFDTRTVRWIWELHELRDLMHAIENCSEIVYDLETTGLDEHADGKNPEWPCAARVVLAQFTLPSEANPMDRKPTTWLVPLSHPESPLLGHWRAVLKSLAVKMRDVEKGITGQNLKFDLRWTYAHTGVDLSDLTYWDTRLGSHMLDETRSASLKPRAAETFGVERWDDFDLSRPAAAEKVPLIDLGMYGARDTYWTWRWAVAQRTLLGVGIEGEDLDPPMGAEEIQQRRLGTLSKWSSMPSSATLTEIEQRGMLLDREWIANKRAENQAVSDEHFAWLVDSTVAVIHEGDPSFAPTSLWFKAWAALAVANGMLRITATTPTGSPQWTKAVLTRQAFEGSEVAQRLLAYRSATKQSEFLDSWVKFMTDKDEIHPQYNLGKVVTGRLSAQDPNVQQVTKALKPAFIPRPGYFFVEADYSQIELRLAAFVSRCEPMLTAYRNGDDLHRLTASVTSGVPLADVTKEQRQKAKAVNFGLLFGMEAEGLQAYAETAYDVHMTAIEAVRARDTFFKTYPELVTWHRKAINRAHQTTQVVSPVGRVRRLPDIHSGDPRTSSHAERQAINSPIQGFASELMQIACASIAGNLPGATRLDDVNLIGTVHDSAVLEVPADDWKRATARVMRRMIDVQPILKRMGCNLDVPICVEATVGTRWGLADVGIIKG